MPFAVSQGCRISFRGGAIFAEKAVVLLTPEIGKAAACERAAEGILPDIAGLTEPEEYLGCAEVFRRRLLEGDR